MELYPYFHIAPKLLEAAQRAEELARPQFREIESIQRYNQQKMLAAFNRAGVSESHFVGSTGYLAQKMPWCATTLSAAPIPSQLPYSVFCGRETRCSASRALPMIPFRVSLA